MKRTQNNIRSATAYLFFRLWLLVCCASPYLVAAQGSDQHAVSNGAGLVSGGNYTGYASAGQMGTYMFSNGNMIATQGIVLNEISSEVIFTFVLNGNLTETQSLKSGKLIINSTSVTSSGPPLAFVVVYLIDAETKAIVDQTTTDANGHFEFQNVQYKNYFLTINSPIVPDEPVFLSFESNIFIKEVVVNGEVGVGGISASVNVVPNDACDPNSPDYAVWYLDKDNDGFGNTKFSVGQCSQPTGYVSKGGDCDDHDSTINPDAVDIAGSGKDANCDGYYLWYLDADGDGFGSSATVSLTSNTPGIGASANNFDCDDANPKFCKDITLELNETGHAFLSASALTDCPLDPNLSYTVSATDFDCGMTGEQLVTLTVTGKNGTSASCTSKVTVVDHLNPHVITGNISVQLDNTGHASIIASDVDAGSTDNCGIQSRSIDISSFGAVNDGTTVTVKLTVVDLHGNSASGTALVQVTGNVQTVFTLPPDIRQVNDPGICGAKINIGVPTVSTNIVKTTNNAPAIFLLGKTVVSWIATLANGTTIEKKQTVEVYNNKPELLQINVANTASTGKTVSAMATFTDMNLTGASWYWGDGTSSSGTISVNSISGNHIYSKTGLYDIKLVIEDACGETDEMSYSFVSIVAYCPGSTKIEGGGQILAAAGSLSKYPLKSGKSAFQFNVEIQNSLNKIKQTCSLAFDFGNGFFKFTSNSSDWVMINNEFAAFSGKGKVNNSGAYNYLVTLMDGNITSKNGSDFFRLIVWDNSGEILFDNQAGKPLTKIPSVKISAGSIKINSPCNHSVLKNSSLENLSPIVKIPADFDAEVYPNPTKGRVNININLSDFVDAMVTVNSITGQQVFKQTYKVKEQITFDLSDQMNGIYMIIIETDGNRVVKKIILNKN